jgi:hypothetical protein
MDNERRTGDRRQDAERREGQDRRHAEDRRAQDLGPPAGVAERRTGWDRRISDRRSGGDRRSGLDRRDPTPEVLLRAVAVQTARQLVSRLYMQVSRSAKSSQRALEHLESARSELLTPSPNLERVAKELDGLKSTSVAKFPEYGLARELLRPLRSNGRGKNGKGKKRSKEPAPSLKRRDSLEQLRATLTAPLSPSEGRGTARKQSASGGKKSSRPTAKAKKKGSKKSSTKSSRKSTSKKRKRPAR